MTNPVKRSTINSRANRKLWIFFTGIVLPILLLGCSSGPKKQLLKIEKPWQDRTQFEKLIGGWESVQKYNPKGRTVATNSLNFKTVFYFYNDYTMERYLDSNSPFGKGKPSESGHDVKIIGSEIHYISDKDGKEKVIKFTLENEYSTKLYGQGTMFADDFKRIN